MTEKGTVRVVSDGLPHNTTVEVFDGTEWLALRCVTAVEWRVEADEGPAKLFLAIEQFPGVFQSLTPRERVALKLLDVPIDPPVVRSAGT